MNAGQQWSWLLRSEGAGVIGAGVPPKAETQCKDPQTDGAKTMTFVWCQAAPRNARDSQMARSAPQLMSIMFSLPDAKNPSRVLSGDQNGDRAPLVPSNRVAHPDAKSRIQIDSLLSGVAATHARRVPSGEIAK
jgi:hypothetical protein